MYILHSLRLKQPSSCVPFSLQLVDRLQAVSSFEVCIQYSGRMELCR